MFNHVTTDEEKRALCRALHRKCSCKMRSCDALQNALVISGGDVAEAARIERARMEENRLTRAMFRLPRTTDGKIILIPNVGRI